MEGGAVRIASYDPAWPSRFAEEREALEQALGAEVTGGIHHVGSTAVPGLDAKPVIDILVGVESLVSSRARFSALAALDYVYAPYREEEMHWFCKPDPDRRTHHLHLVPTGSRRFNEEIAFRDALRTHPEVAADYAALKHRLARALGHDREAYTAAKTGFIRAVLARDVGAREPVRPDT